MTNRPLEGIRILDLTQYLAGPLGTQILADLGAEVIKIERGDGKIDFTRNTDPSFGSTSAYFVSISRRKKDVALDLNREEHKKVLLALAQKCDVVAENYKAGTMEKLGLSYDVLCRTHPNLIYSRLSGFGQDGPYAAYGCVDIIAQAMSGFMSVTGQPDSTEPVKGGSPVADICSGLYEAIGIIAMLIYREKTGEGGAIDIAMLSSILSLMAEPASEYLNNGIVWGPEGNRDRETGFCQTVPTRDGSVFTAASDNMSFKAFMHLLGLDELCEDARFADAQSRYINADALEQYIFPITAQQTMNELTEACRANGVPAGEVNTQERLYRSGYLEQRNMIYQVYDRKEGDFKVIGLPLSFDKFEIPNSASVPELGDDTEEVLTTLLGMTKPEITALYQK